MTDKEIMKLVEELHEKNCVLEDVAMWINHGDINSKTIIYNIKMIKNVLKKYD